MFQPLKTRNNRESKFKNLPNAGTYPSNGFSAPPTATSYQVKGNEKDRLVRCRFCGWICDKERDVKQRPDTWAGLGIAYGAQLTAGTSVGDRRVPAAGAVAATADQYHARTINGGCPCCGSYIYWT